MYNNDFFFSFYLGAILLLLDHVFMCILAALDYPKKVYTAYTFVKQDLRWSGLVYTRCTLSTLKQMQVLSSAALIQHGGKIANLEIDKIF